jgi:hypothetical protein
MGLPNILIQLLMIECSKRWVCLSARIGGVGIVSGLKNRIGDWVLCLLSAVALGR